MKRATIFLALFALTFQTASEAGEKKKKSPKQTIVKLVPSDPHSGKGFGYTVSIDGDYAIVGAVGDKSMGMYTGTAYVFHRTGADSWDGGVKLLPTDASSVDWVGCSVAVGGDYALVAACEKDTGSGTPIRDAGAVYVYQRVGTNVWNNIGTLTSPDAHADQQFGKSVSISGEYAAVAAFRDKAVAPNAGSVYVFRRTGANTWDSGVRVVAPDASAGLQFGSSVSISGDYMIVGATGDDQVARNSGAAYVYLKTGQNAWDSSVKLVAADAQAEDHFGMSVDIDDDYAVVGARDVGDYKGAAYVFHRTGANTWDSGTKLVPPDDGSSFGESVSISGDKIIVGAPARVGAVYVFQRTTGNAWDFSEKIVPSDIGSGDKYGCSVAIDGESIIAGAKTEDSIDTGVGAAYVR